MFNLRLWNKTVGKSQFKCVTDHYFNKTEEDYDLNSTNLKLLHVTPNSLIKNGHKLLPQGCDTLLSSFAEKKLDCITWKHHYSSTNMTQKSSFVDVCLTNSVPFLTVISRCNFSTTSTSGNDKKEIPKKEELSVLGSMGIDRNSDKKSSGGTDGSFNEDKDSADKEKTDQKESAFLRSQRYAKWMLLVTFGVGTPIFVLRFGAPKHDDLGEEVKDQYSDKIAPLAYLLRAWKEVNVFKKDIVEPSSKKLLPDPLTEPYYQPPYTLVIELMDVFLRPVYDSVSGWRFKKRPGIDYFLSQVGPPLFEVVIFTRETGMTAFPLIDSMDQKGYIMYRLFRDAARYKSGFSVGNPLKGVMPKLDPYYQKDLTYLNRDLSKVILVDCDKRAFENHPENGFCLDKWDGSSNDTTLYDLAGLLRTIATSNVEDVRPVLQHYAKTDKPIESFKLAQAKMQQDNQFALQNVQPSFIGSRNTISSFLKRR